MDRRLLDAAWNGNVQELRELVKENRRIIYNDSLTDKVDTPLHISCMAGHLNFVKELMKLWPDLASMVSSIDGLTPLHIASAQGYVEICIELLEYDKDLCLIKGIGKIIPLHCAVMKGRLKVVTELVTFNTADSVGAVTARGETVLHLAVKNNQFRVFEYLVKHHKQLNMEHILDEKDNQGNSILHLAVSRKLYQDFTRELINFLLVIAVLVATATYQAVLSPPGGYWQEDRKVLKHVAGKAIMATKNPIGFKVFVFFNTLGFYISLSMILVLTSKFPMRLELILSVFAMCFTYGATVSTITPVTLVDMTFIHLCIASGIFILTLIKLHWNHQNARR